MARSGALLALGLLGGLLLSRCDGGSQGSLPVAPDALLLNRVPSDLPQHVTLDRDLDATGVASGTMADPAAVHKFLSSAAFHSAHVRIWTQAPDYVTMMSVAFDRPPDASKFVELEAAQLKNSINSYVTPHSQIPGSYVFVISSPTRSGAKNVICEGVWQAASMYAIETLTCSDRGKWAARAEELAQQAHDQAKRLLG
ncbi:MAG: hypothetical protein ABR573_03630 [Candidatus Dormibacteria bacterium]